jgi:mono/diheme cytochrome c family protein
MKSRLVIVSALVTASALCFAKADGSWLKKVPDADHARVNPYASDPTATSAGANLFRNSCAKCHGQEGVGKSSRPALKSDRIEKATDGDLAWILKNGEPYKGMPTWGSLPEQQRWQLVAYVRSLNATASGVQK